MVTLEYIQDKPFPEDYLNLLKEYHSKDFEKTLSKMEWYKSNFDFRILLARLDGVPAGQSCAYKVGASLSGSDTDIWWGVDAFVLSKARGHGIGKKLQMKLHHDLPNFSSAWYSPTNGHIKKKCGAKELADLKFCYYPISKFFIPLSFLVSKKLFGKGFCPNIRLPFFYSAINGLCNNHSGTYSYKEINPLGMDDSFFSNIASFLQDKDFYVKRDKAFFELKYGAKHGLKYHAFAVYQGDVLEAFFAFTEVKDMHWVMAPIKGVKILDSIINPDSKLTLRDFNLFIARYYKSKRKEIDGVLSLQETKYCPQFTYPHPSTPLLSMADSEKVNKAYVSYIDQDMEY